MGCLMASCANREGRHTDRSVTTLSVVPGSLVEKAKSSELFSSVSIVSLETNQDVLLNGEIVKIDRKGDDIYVADRSAVYKFGSDGSLLKKMSKLGPGPEEHRSISDVEIIDDDSLWILCRGNQTLYKFDWEGKLLDLIKLNCWAAKMYLLSPEQMCLYIGNEMNEDNRHQLRTINPVTGEVIGRYKEIDPKEARYIHMIQSNRFSLSANGMYYFSTYYDNIYELRDGILSPVYYVNILNKNIPDSFFDKEYADIRDFSEARSKRDFAYGTNLFIESDNVYLFSYMYDKTCHYAFISKDTKESFVDFTTIVEDVSLQGYPIKLLEQKAFIQKNNELILPVQPFDVMQYAQENMSAEEISQLKQKLKLSEDDQNPVLLILKI
jgi:hypothetical protein